MKKLLKTLLIVTVSYFSTSLCFSQAIQLENSRNIEVTGSAEMNIKPDELEIEFTLKEYYVNKKDKFSLSAAEDEFFKRLEKYGLKEKDIILENNLYWNNWYSSWKSKQEELKYKKISVRIDSSINFLQLIKDVDEEWLDDITISKMKNKNEQTFRKEVKIQAIKAAKEKASYLLAAIDEKLGKVISVEELEGSGNFYWSPNSVSNNAYVNISGNSGEISNTNLIKLRYEVKVRFEIL